MKDLLIVDDDTALLELISQILELNGLTSETAENGLDALEKCKGKYYPLVISDINMPKMNGTEFVKELKRYQEVKEEKSKIIFITAYSTPEIIEQAEELGVDDFISKPFDVDDFIKRTKKALGKDDL